MLQEITKEDFRNIDALWQWIKRECERGNVEGVKLETHLHDIPVDDMPFKLKRVSGRVLTITLGPALDYSDLNI